MHGDCSDDSSSDSDEDEEYEPHPDIYQEEEFEEEEEKDEEAHISKEERLNIINSINSFSYHPKGKVST